MGATEHTISVEPLGKNETFWQEFLNRSANGTLFHDLGFLAYHPKDRFHFLHLILRRDGKPIAILPGGLTESGNRPFFSSPLGASIGGLAVGAGLSAEMAIAIVQALQDYARQERWAGIQMTLPPAYYSFETSDLMEFALFSLGFRLEHRWLCHTLRLSPEPNGFERSFKTRQCQPVRLARRSGFSAVETGAEGLAAFVLPFRETYSRHGVPATHSEEEIEDLLKRFPDKIRIHLAMYEDAPIAALLVFHLTTKVATTFYICRSSNPAHQNGPAFLIAETMDKLSSAGFQYLDFGPSGSELKLNKGVSFFKEGLGGIGQCRNGWQWDAG